MSAPGLPAATASGHRCNELPLLTKRRQPFPQPAYSHEWSLKPLFRFTDLWQIMSWHFRQRNKPSMVEEGLTRPERLGSRKIVSHKPGLRRAGGEGGIRACSC